MSRRAGKGRRSLDDHDRSAGIRVIGSREVAVDEVLSTVHDALAAINRAWRENRPLEMRAHLDPNVTMVLPGFRGQVVGRDALLASFVEFSANARVLEYRESDKQIQIIGGCAVASFRFEMVYERPGYRERSSGRDLWVFQRTRGKWRAVWRTMLDLTGTREAEP